MIMPINRRTFTKQVVTGVIATAPVASLKAGAGENGAPANDDKPEPARDEAKPPAPADLVRELVKRLYPENLDEAKLSQIHGQIEHHMSRSRVLGAFPLTNADEPAPVFAAWRAEG
jgi:hypothetical protein